MVSRPVDMAKLQALAAKGYPVDFGWIDAPFNVFVTCVTTGDVDVTLLRKFSRRLTKVVRASGFECELLDIVLMFSIRNPEISPGARERMSWRSKDRLYAIDRHIDFDLWQAASFREQKAMLTRCTLECIERIPTKRLSDASKAALAALVREAMRPIRA